MLRAIFKVCKRATTRGPTVRRASAVVYALQSPLEILSHFVPELECISYKIQTAILVIIHTS